MPTPARTLALLAAPQHHERRLSNHLAGMLLVCGGWKVSEEETNAFSVVQMDGMD